MAMGRPKAELMLRQTEQAQLQSIARSRSLPGALSLRAKFVLACAAGEPNSSVATRIRRGSFGSVKQLIKRIDHFVAHYNQNCKPFTWTATAESILAKLERLCARI